MNSTWQRSASDPAPSPPRGTRGRRRARRRAAGGPGPARRLGGFGPPVAGRTRRPRAGPGPGAVAHERVVEQGQILGRHGRGVSPAASGRRVGRVEDLGERVRHGSFDEGIDRAPPGCGTVADVGRVGVLAPGGDGLGGDPGPERRTVHRRIQPPAGGEHRVAQRLGLQPDRAAVPEQAILGVDWRVRPDCRPSPCDRPRS